MVVRHSQLFHTNFLMKKPHHYPNKSYQRLFSNLKVALKALHERFHTQRWVEQSKTPPLWLFTDFAILRAHLESSLFHENTGYRAAMSGS